MEIYFWEPIFGDMPSGQATSSAGITNSKPIVANQAEPINQTAGFFCRANGYNFEYSFRKSGNSAGVYYDDNTMSWKTASKPAYYQIVCDDGLQATTSVSVNLSSSTVQLENGYNGLNFHESLFIAGIMIFFLAFMTWSRISYTNVS